MSTDGDDVTDRILREIGELPDADARAAEIADLPAPVDLAGAAIRFSSDYLLQWVTDRISDEAADPAATVAACRRGLAWYEDVVNTL